MTTQGSHPVRSLWSRPLKVPKYQRTHREGLPVGEQAGVLRPALEVEAQQGVGRHGTTNQWEDRWRHKARKREEVSRKATIVGRRRGRNKRWAAVENVKEEEVDCVRSRKQEWAERSMRENRGGGRSEMRKQNKESGQWEETNWGGGKNEKWKRKSKIIQQVLDRKKKTETKIRWRKETQHEGDKIEEYM